MKTVGQFRHLTTNLHLVARAFFDVIGWSTIATMIKRAQIHDRRDMHCQWDCYPANRFGWVAFGKEDELARFVGVGVQPEKKLHDDEILIRVELPFTGCGRDIKELVANELVRAKRNKERVAS